MILLDGKATAEKILENVKKGGKSNTKTTSSCNNSYPAHRERWRRCWKCRP